MRMIRKTPRGETGVEVVLAKNKDTLSGFRGVRLGRWLDGYALSVVRLYICMYILE